MSGKRQVRPVRVMQTSVGDHPVLTLQGAVVFDCRPSVAPGVSGPE